MGDPITTKLLEAAVGKTVEVLFSKANAYANRNTTALLAAWEADRGSWILEWRTLVEHRIRQLEMAASDHTAFVAALQRMVEDPQFWKLHVNLEWEAARETLKERQRMLAYLGAGLSDPDMSINDKARVERTTRSLDPKDISVLRQMARNPSLMGSALEKNGVSYYALVSAGCISEGNGAYGAIPAATPLAALLLRVLEAYVPEEDLG